MGCGVSSMLSAASTSMEAARSGAQLPLPSDSSCKSQPATVIDLRQKTGTSCAGCQIEKIVITDCHDRMKLIIEWHMMMERPAPMQPQQPLPIPGGGNIYHQLQLFRQTAEGEWEKAACHMAIGPDSVDGKVLRYEVSKSKIGDESCEVAGFQYDCFWDQWSAKPTPPSLGGSGHAYFNSIGAPPHPFSFSSLLSNVKDNAVSFAKAMDGRCVRAEVHCKDIRDR